MTIQEKIADLKRMHKSIIDIGDEDIYYEWIEGGVPDEPYQDILEYIASACYEDVKELYEYLTN